MKLIKDTTISSPFVLESKLFPNLPYHLNSVDTYKVLGKDAVLTGTQLKIQGGCQVVISSSPKNNDLTLKGAEKEAKDNYYIYPKGIMKPLRGLTIESEIATSNIENFPELSYPLGCKKGCLIAVATPAFSFKVRGVCYRQSDSRQDQTLSDLVSPNKIKKLMKVRNMLELIDCVLNELYRPLSGRPYWVEAHRYPGNWDYDSGSRTLVGPDFDDPRQKQRTLNLKFYI